MARPVDQDWPSPLEPSVRSARAFALVIAASFAAVGVLWIFVTDVLLYATSYDSVLLARIETVIDWGFVAFATVLISVVARRAVAKLNRARTVLSTVVEAIGDGLLVVGPDRTIVYANPAACRMLACRKPSDVIGMTARQFSRRYLVTRTTGAVVPPEDFVTQRAFTEPGPLRRKALLHPTEGSELVVLSTAAPVRSQPDRRASFVVSVMHDVTDTDNLEQLRDRFFAAAAHALKTPVAIIKANVQFISRGSPGALQPSLAAVERQCDRIDRLVQNLQVVSRARSHSLELKMQPTELGPLVLQVVREIGPAGAARVIHADIASSPVVYGDRERLATAIRNSIHEAMRGSTPRTPVRLTLSANPCDAELAVTFQPLAVAERMFAGAEQYDDTTLSRCATETIAEAHGGTVGETQTATTETIWMRIPTTGERHDRPDGRSDRGR
jgi:signal transduction histidine kinase